MPQFRTKGRGRGRKVYPVSRPKISSLHKKFVPQKNIEWYSDEYLPSVMRNFNIDLETANKAIDKASEYDPADEKEANGWIAWVLVEDLKKHPDLQLKDGLLSLKDPKALQLAEARYNADMDGLGPVRELEKTTTLSQELQARAFSSAVLDADLAVSHSTWLPKEMLASSPKQRAFNQSVVRE